MPDTKPLHEPTAEIAAALTDAQRKALCWLPAGGEWASPLDEGLDEDADDALDSLQDLGLAFFGEDAYAVQMSPRGEEVRLHLYRAAGTRLCPISGAPCDCADLPREQRCL